MVRILLLRPNFYKAIRFHINFRSAYFPCPNRQVQIKYTCWYRRGREPLERKNTRYGENHVSYAISGLEAPVEILIDSWGVPHIYASSTYDAFFAQGFNAARDRLWQIDLWRRRGLGLLSGARPGCAPPPVPRQNARGVARLWLGR